MKRERISPMTEMMMGWAAWAAYGLNFLIEIVAGWIGIGLIASIIFMIMAYSCFVIWFIFKGVNVFDPKLIGNFAFGAFISSIPIINLFYISLDKKTGVPTPGIRKNVGKVIALIQKEDEEYNKALQSKKNPKVEQTPLQRQQEKIERLEQIRAQQQAQINAAEDNKDLYDEAA
jgi:hypothetical protein